MKKNDLKLEVGAEKISVEDVYNIAANGGEIFLSDESAFKRKIKKSREILNKKLDQGDVIYGVTTGYGDSCDVEIPKELQKKLPLRLTRYHQCGLGEDFSYIESRSIQLVRIISLSQGHSAVRYELLEFMVDLFNRKISPRIPKEGSVGASGDLTPLSYYAATLVGEGQCIYDDKVYDTNKLFKQLEIGPIELLEKEALALMNGTAVMTGLSCIAFMKSYYLAEISARITSTASLALLANSAHFSKEVFKAKPHRGTIEAAKWIRKDLTTAYNNKALSRLQDRYSIRCAPHVIGVLLDGLSFYRSLLETEINSANDNPLIDLEREEILHGGNFYGGHISFAMDGLKVLIANISDLLDRQIALLVDKKFNNGLPANLAKSTPEGGPLNHGLKALQISSSAWTAECLKNSGPASIFSRSTECHNQDKVSMGTISSRDCLRCIELANQVAAAAVITTRQALEIRIEKGELFKKDIGGGILNFLKKVKKIVDIVEEDRPLEPDLRIILDRFDNLDRELIR